MPKWPFLGPSLVLAFVVLVADPHNGGIGDAEAQLTPTPLAQPGATDPKPTGVAEEAKEGVDQLPTTPVIPQTKSKRKRFELFELDGYYRFRTDWMKNFNLGFSDVASGGAPFPLALACKLEDVDDCSETVKTANMRLRLEPTINVTETTQVYFQVDVLDNVVLGSTPERLGLGDGRSDIPIGGFSDNQSPPEADRNNLRDSIQVKQAWAEVETSLGQVSFGRMPWHWGMGIYANSGGSDPFSNTYDLDSDFGDTVDRLMFRAQIPGTPIDAAIATDWSSTFPVASHDALFRQRINGQPWDLDDKDDVSQWVFMITRFDKPKLFNEIIARGDVAMNYGGFLAYRTQKNAINPFVDDGTTEDPPDYVLVERGLKTYSPNVWFKAGWEDFLIEAEAMLVFGSVDNVSDIVLDPDADNNDRTLDENQEVDIRRFGGVARGTYKTLEDKLRLSLEVGFASGDQWDNQQPGETHISNARPLAVGGDDTTISNFVFDQDYSVDMILFRELLGAVTNAGYFKPTLTYDFTSEIAVRASAILSFSNKPVATPGNGRMLGAEFNGDIGYNRDGFFAGVSYGILFPLAGLDHPMDTGVNDGPGFGFGGNTGDAGNAQTIQTRLMLQF